jgi:fructose-bisphosphate aldolase class I
MDLQRLCQTAQALVAKTKGILAADESSNTIRKRLAAVGVESTEESRRKWRSLLFSTATLGSYASGVILFDETIRQRADDGRSFVELLNFAGVIPGIKVDRGIQPLAQSPAEVASEGLDGLRERLLEYAGFGARFSKWRAVIRIAPGLPTAACISVNAHALGRFAALSQECGLVPIVEPEVLVDGDHSIERCFEASEATLRRVYQELYEQGVCLEGTLLKPSMVLSGKAAASRAPAAEVAAQTLRCFKRCVPAAVPGLVFLSGGQTDAEATGNLDAINKLGRIQGAPWELSFSFGRGRGRSR